jgi:hypothetical protein
MSESGPVIVLTEHPAVRAWAALGCTSAMPAAVSRLQKRAKGHVYRLVGAGPQGASVVAKRSSPERIGLERTIYESVLPRLPMAKLRYYGCIEEQDSAYWWVFMEDAGEELYAPFLASHRTEAARWLAAVHTAAASLGVSDALPDRGPDYYRGHLSSARATLARSRSNTRLTREQEALVERVDAQCELAERHWSEVHDLCAALPRTLVHGDFAPKNMRVRSGNGGMELLPFDWGSAGWGVMVADMAQAARPRASGARPDLTTYWANPDLAVYREAVRGQWPHVAARDLEPLAVVGKLFRCLVCISLEAPSFETEWAEVSVPDMTANELEMADAIAAAGWSS